MSLTNKTFLDDAGLQALWGKVTGKLSGKVDKVEGKQLSTEDYTTAEKTKLSGIETGAEVNDIVAVQVNGTDLTPDANRKVNVEAITGVSVNGAAQAPTSGVVDVTVPTNNNQLTNGAGYQTASDVSSAIATAVAGITAFDYEVVQTLPQTGTKGVIYLVPNSGSGTNIYDEYIYISTDGGTTFVFEKIGTTEMDLSNYWNGTNLTPITSTRIDEVCV